MGGGVIENYDNLIYAKVQYLQGLQAGGKMWFISPFKSIKVGDKVKVPCGSASVEGIVERVENVTKQTAPYPVNRTREIEEIL
jgi:hypothetical protein